MKSRWSVHSALTLPTCSCVLLCEELLKDSSSFCGWGSEKKIVVFHIVPHSNTYAIDHSITPVQSHLTVMVWEREGEAEMQNSTIIHVEDFPAK